MEIAIKILQLLLSLSILVIVHELGHFMAAKFFNTRV
jgi:regulator of sigma E protease